MAKKNSKTNTQGVSVQANAVTTSAVSALEQRVEDLSFQNEILAESLADLAMRWENIGWESLNSFDNSSTGPDLATIKKFSKVSTDAVPQNPMLKRALDARAFYVFGQGLDFRDVKPKAQKIIDSPVGKRAVFGQAGRLKLLTQMFTCGNVFLLSNGRGDFINVPLEQISNVATDPDAADQIWYVQRQWTKFDGSANPKTVKRWYRTQMFSGTSKRSIADVPVDGTWVMLIDQVNKQPGWTWGIPDTVSAMKYVQMYADYLSDSYLQNKAYTKLLGKITGSVNEKIASNTAAQVYSAGQSHNPGFVGLGSGQDLSMFNKGNNSVNFDNARPLLAQVAAALGVSLVLISSDPGTGGGSYGTAQTLDMPTLLFMRNEQERWKEFMQDTLIHLGSPNASVEFPNIDKDAPYRQISSISLAYEHNLVTDEEGRTLVRDVLDIPAGVEGKYKFENDLEQQKAMQQFEGSTTDGAQNPRGGPNGGAGNFSDGDNSARDEGK